MFSVFIVSESRKTNILEDYSYSDLLIKEKTHNLCFILRTNNVVCPDLYEQCGGRNIT